MLPGCEEILKPSVIAHNAVDDAPARAHDLGGIPATKVLVLLDTCSSGRFSLTRARQLDEKTAIDKLASYIDRALPEITKRKWGYEQFPVMETHGNIFPVVRHGE